MTSLDFGPIEATHRRHPAHLVPMYRRVSDDLLRVIESRRMKPGDPLPSEAALCDSYGVSRITVRKALDELVTRHLIVRRRGAGTFISDAESISKAVVLSGFIDDVLMLNRMTVLGQRSQTLPPHLASLARGMEGVQFKCITGVNHITPDEPVVHIEFYFPPEIARHVAESDVAGPMPTIKHIEKTLGVRLDHANQTVDAVAASTRVAAALGISRGAPVLRALRAYYDASGGLIELFEAQYHPTRYQFSAVLFPKHA